MSHAYIPGNCAFLECCDERWAFRYQTGKTDVASMSQCIGLETAIMSLNTVPSWALNCGGVRDASSAEKNGIMLRLTTMNLRS